MAGQIISRGERAWLVRVFGGRDGTGKRRYLNKTIHGTKKDAQRYLNRVLAERDLGTYVEPTAKTLNRYLDEWLLNAAKRSVGARTFYDYESLLNRYVRGPLGARHVSQISPLDIQRLYGELQERGLSSRTVRYTHAVLSSALKQAVKWRMLAQNPAGFVDLPRHVRREMQVLSPEDVRRFLAASEMDRWSVLFSFALATGMRPGEYLALPWSNLDLRRRTATVRRALTYVKGKWQFAEPKTSRSRRAIPLPPTVVKQLALHKSRQLEGKRFMGSEYSELDLVFASETGRPLDKSNLMNRHFRPILRRAGLPETLRLHDLRHTCATLLLVAGENPKVVSERLGHASVTLTLDTYSHVLPTMQKRATERLESIMFSGPTDSTESDGLTQ